MEEVLNRHNGLRLSLVEETAPRRRFEVVFRAFDDGVAFRYEVPDQAGLGAFEIMDEHVVMGLAENTLVIYMGDNGFALGEHGLIDKRHSYEESIRIPMLAWAPGWIEAGERACRRAPQVLERVGMTW